MHSDHVFLDVAVFSPVVNISLQEIKIFRTNLALLCNFDWVPIPIAYPQIDLYIPFMTILQFIFFFGWMKVVEALLNPLGEDDDDFECNFLIDKNIATGLSIVDETYDYCPELRPDRFMDPNYEPVYSEESQKRGNDNALVGSAEGIKWVLCRISAPLMDYSSRICHNS
ncbi:hypothetical protein ANCDUO_01130 [Ancylostoma duodenale]|uniref:Bestrophin homolog n=1 Tax=Ancylostoma duodenale TaxID=51022 RepID=A0A0C2DEY9_9BILA|nr:hypothetical protein ANCDUO_01130 [Ancylostoma duodenale]